MKYNRKECQLQLIQSILNEILPMRLSDVCIDDKRFALKVLKKHLKEIENTLN